jgi:hypothetical protein
MERSALIQGMMQMVPLAGFEPADRNPVATPGRSVRFQVGRVCQFRHRGSGGCDPQVVCLKPPRLGVTFF